MFQGRSRLVPVLALLALLGGCPQGGTRPPESPPETKTPYDTDKAGAALVQELADRFGQASTDAARREALLYLLRALNVGVYTIQGEAILVGAERAPNDFFLYDFELEMLARALGRGQQWRVDDLTALLAEAGVRPEGQPLPASLLGEVLHEGTEEALRAPEERSSLVPLLVRELGLRRDPSQDLATRPPREDLTFDALQTWLIISDFGLPIIKEKGPVSGASGLVEASGGIFRRRALQGSPEAMDLEACKDIGRIAKEEWSFGKWAVTLSKKAGNFVKVASVAMDGIHGMILAFGIQVQEMEPSISGHYGHEASAPELRFRVRVEMLDELPEVVVQCGWLSGVEFPPKGPVSNVTVKWENGDGDITQHGTPHCGLPCTTTTQADGIATLVVQPRDELVPGLGPLSEETGTVMGLALYQSRHRNVLGAAAQVLVPKYAHTRWFIARHDTPKLELAFSSTVSQVHHREANARYDASMASTVQLEWRRETSADGTPFVYAVGSAPLAFQSSFIHGMDACPDALLSKAPLSPTTVAVVPLEKLDRVLLYFSPGLWTETWLRSLSGPNGACANSTLSGGSFASGTWNVAHVDEFNFQGPVALGDLLFLFTIRDFQRGAAGELRKDYSWTSPDSFSHESTTLLLRQVP